MIDKRTGQRGNAGLLVLFLFVIAALAAALYVYFQQGDNAPGGSSQTETADDASSVAAASDADESAAGDDTGEDETGEDETGDDDIGEDAAATASDEGSDVLQDETGATFSFLPVGDLLPESGPGFVDATIYRPDIVFPTADRAYLNSQVYRYGGYYGSVNGMEGGQCNAENYQYPWQDTFCEKRSRDQELCPGGGHEGLDIRPASCTKDVHWAVAVEDARVVDVRRHWVTLQTADGTLYNYLHLNMAELEVSEGDTVAKGARLGRISNDFYKSDGTSVATTIHLHFEMYENYAASADDEPLFTKVNPYTTLVSAYDRRLRDE